MPYSKPRYTSRKYLPPDKNYMSIPYPNEVEDHYTQKNNRRDLFNISSIIDFLKSRITIEEIILVGLIIILLDDEIKDEFLLIMLVYILLF